MIPRLASWFFPVSAIALWPFIFIRKGCDSPTLINHETIHHRQCLETLIVGFYLIYLLEWLVHLIRLKSPSRAYRNIRFEVEAYRFESDLTYLKNRPFWAWIRL